MTLQTNIYFSECSLDKELYYHGETISVNVHIQVIKLSVIFISKNLHELFVKVRPRICQLHRNMLNALLKVNMFDSE